MLPWSVQTAFHCSVGIFLLPRAVWSEDEGYPGDFAYREFYRDVGFDLPIDYIRPYIHDNDIRIYTGFKYYAITGKTDKKRAYNPVVAAAKTKEHAANFLYNRSKQAGKLQRFMDRPPMIVCPYDAELFGHWWFEGPIWLENIIRLAAEDSNGLEMVTPSDYLETYPENPKGAAYVLKLGKQGLCGSLD